MSLLLSQVNSGASLGSPLKKNPLVLDPAWEILSPPLQQVERTYVRCGESKLSYFGGCDYFRLSSHALVLKALQDGLQKYGLNVAASRSTTGNHELYERLEARLAEFFDAPAAVLLSSGYLANLAVTQALAGTRSHALIDERAHASLRDAAQFLNCPVVSFKSRDAGDLAKTLRRIGPKTRPLILTDGMFSHDGSFPPMKKYLQVLPQNGLVLLDDAHGAGVLGKTGKGTLEQTGVTRRGIIQTIALSKAFGVYGGAILCDTDLRKLILAKSRLFNGNTPLPLPLANAVMKAIDILSSSNSLRTRLLQNIKRVKAALQKMGHPTTDSLSPIIPLIPRHPDEVPQLKRELIANGVFPSFIKYPAGADTGYFRFAISSEHSRAQIDRLLRFFKNRSGRP